jgi:hypothetical protein
VSSSLVRFAFAYFYLLTLICSSVQSFPLLSASAVRGGLNGSRWSRGKRRWRIDVPRPCSRLMLKISLATSPSVSPALTLLFYLTRKKKKVIAN